MRAACSAARRRQDLPREAFISVEELKGHSERQSTSNDGLQKTVDSQAAALEAMRSTIEAQVTNDAAAIQSLRQVVSEQESAIEHLAETDSELAASKAKVQKTLETQSSADEAVIESLRAAIQRQAARDAAAARERRDAGRRGAAL